MGKLTIYIGTLPEAGIQFPETGLHPRMKLAFARDIAVRVNAGENIVIGTFCDYIIKELNTLIMLYPRGSSPERKRLSLIAEKYGYEKEHLLDYKNVTIYSETLEPYIVHKELGMAVPCFDVVINKMNDIQDDIMCS
jgi:hypothetical protein